MPRLALVVAVVIAFTACHRENSKFCGLAENMNEPECMEPVVGGPCQDSDECPSNLPICDQTLNEGTCVLCTDSDRRQCMGMTPRCENRMCVACIDDIDCGQNGVCLSDRTCAAESRIIHAKASGGSNSAGCGAIDNECTLTRAFVEVTTDRNIVKLDDATTYTSPPGGYRIVTNTPFTIDARGAELRRSDNGQVLFIEEDGFVTILGGTISSARGGSSHGIECTAGATLTIDGTTITANEESAIVTNDCILSIKGAIISNNSSGAGKNRVAIDMNKGSLIMSLTKLLSNRGGGVRIASDGAFTIVGSLFYNNGQLTSSVAALSLENTTASIRRLEFNTVVDNHNAPGSPQGMFCNVENFTARNNIVWTTQTTTDPMTTGLCTHNYSNIWQPLPLPMSGEGNINADPLFESQSDLRVKLGSPVDGKADPAADVSGIAEFDLDGKKRPIGQADIGAYEVPTQQ